MENYEAHSAMILKVGLINSQITNTFQNLLNEHILPSIKIFPDFSLETIDNSNTDITLIFTQCNFIFCITTLNDLSITVELLASLNINPKTYVFIVIDGCDNMEFDDDEDLIFADREDNTKFQKFKKQLSAANIVNDKMLYIFKISVPMCNIWKQIQDDGSIVNLSESQIDTLAPTIIRRSSKMSISDKKREIKIMLKKKINVEDKLKEYGYSGTLTELSNLFKIVNQKKLVMGNYLNIFHKVAIDIECKYIGIVDTILNEIYAIKFLNSGMLDDLIDQINVDFFDKIKIFCELHNKNLSCGTNDAHKYHTFLTTTLKIVVSHDLPNIIEYLNNEIGLVNTIIVDFYKKEVENITDLNKMASVLEIFASKDTNNFTALFDKIKTHPSIMQSYIEKMDQWIVFIDKCLELSIPRESVIRLIEEIIISKINYHNGISQPTNKLFIIYPQCLQIFLQSHLNVHFIFQKLYMYSSYVIKYHGRNNMAEYIKNLTIEQFNSLLVLENKLLELCYDVTRKKNKLKNMDTLESFDNTYKQKKIPKITNQEATDKIKSETKVTEKIKPDTKVTEKIKPETKVTEKIRSEAKVIEKVKPEAKVTEKVKPETKVTDKSKIPATDRNKATDKIKPDSKIPATDRIKSKVVSSDSSSTESSQSSTSSESESSASDKKVVKKNKAITSSSESSVSDKKPVKKNKASTSSSESSGYKKPVTTTKKK